VLYLYIGGALRKQNVTILEDVFRAQILYGPCSLGGMGSDNSIWEAITTWRLDSPTLDKCINSQSLLIHNIIYQWLVGGAFYILENGTKTMNNIV